MNFNESEFQSAKQFQRRQLCRLDTSNFVIHACLQELHHPPDSRNEVGECKPNKLQHACITEQQSSRGQCTAIDYCTTWKTLFKKTGLKTTLLQRLQSQLRTTVHLWSLAKAYIGRCWHRRAAPLRARALSSETLMFSLPWKLLSSTNICQPLWTLMAKKKTRRRRSCDTQNGSKCVLPTQNAMLCGTCHVRTGLVASNHQS